MVPEYTFICLARHLNSDNSVDYRLSGVVSEYESLIWSLRWNALGDCQITVPFDATTAVKYSLGSMIVRVEDRTAMIVSRVDMTQKTPGEPKLNVFATSITSWLTKRLCWSGSPTIGYGADNVSPAVFVTNMFNSVFGSLAESATLSRPQIKGLSFGGITGEGGLVTGTTLPYYQVGPTETFYAASVGLLSAFQADISVRIPETVNVWDVVNEFVVVIDGGQDRANPTNTRYLIFSRDNGSVTDEEYTLDTNTTQTCALVLGTTVPPEMLGLPTGTQDVDTQINTWINAVPTVPAIDLSEMTIDGSQISYAQLDGDGTPIEGSYTTLEDYINRLTVYGQTQIINAYGLGERSSFSGGSNTRYFLNKDYGLGDTMVYYDIMGDPNTIQVIEVVYSDSQSGIFEYPAYQYI